jgi:hypothetical protein
MSVEVVPLSAIGTGVKNTAPFGHGSVGIAH